MRHVRLSRKFGKTIQKTLSFKDAPEDSVKTLIISRSLTDNQVLGFLMESYRVGYGSIYKTSKTLTIYKPYACDEVITFSTAKVVFYKTPDTEQFFVLPLDYELNNFIVYYNAHKNEFMTIS